MASDQGVAASSRNAISPPGKIGFVARVGPATGNRNRWSRPSPWSDAHCPRQGRPPASRLGPYRGSGSSARSPNPLTVEPSPASEIRGATTARRAAGHARCAGSGHPKATSTVNDNGLRSPRRAITGRSGAQRSLSLRSSLSRRREATANLRRCGSASRGRSDFLADARQSRSRIEAKTRGRRIGTRPHNPRVVVQIDDEAGLRASVLTRPQDDFADQRGRFRVTQIASRRREMPPFIKSWSSTWMYSRSSVVSARSRSRGG